MLDIPKCNKLILWSFFHDCLPAPPKLISIGFKSLKKWKLRKSATKSRGFSVGIVIRDGNMGTSVSEPWIGLVSECGVPCFYRQAAWHHSCTIMHHITRSRSGPNKQQYYSPLSPGHQKYVCCISSHHLNFSTARETGIKHGILRCSAQRLMQLTVSLNAVLRA